MEDTIVVQLPSRGWALAAIDELGREGCRARLLPRGDDEPGWSLLVTGPPDAIDLIRCETRVTRSTVCWETFVNAAVGSAPGEEPGPVNPG